MRVWILKTERLLQFRWSSLWWFVQRKRPECLVPDAVLAESDRLADTKAGWRRYVDYLKVLAEEDNKKRGEEFGRLSCGWIVGTKEFKTELTKEPVQRGGCAERVALLGGGPEAHGSCARLKCSARSRELTCQGDYAKQVECMQLPERIQIRPEVMGGKPCIKGTRVPVYLLLQKMAASETTEAILAAYPQLTRADLAACLDYASQLAAEEAVLAAR